MWRSLLLGKLSVAILASLAIGAICISQPWRVTGPLNESLGWFATGAFFLVLGIGLLLAVFLMFRKPK